MKSFYSVAAVDVQLWLREFCKSKASLTRRISRGAISASPAGRRRKRVTTSGRKCLTDSDATPLKTIEKFAK